MSELLTHKQVLDWLNRGKNVNTSKNYEWQARGCTEATEAVQRFIADYAKKGGKWDTLAHRLALTRPNFNKLIKDEPLLFDAFMMGMEYRIDELIQEYNALVLGGKDNSEGVSEKYIDRLKQHAESLTVDMNALYNRIGNQFKSKDDLIDADETEFL